MKYYNKQMKIFLYWNNLLILILLIIIKGVSWGDFSGLTWLFS